MNTSCAVAIPRYHLLGISKLRRYCDSTSQGGKLPLWLSWSWTSASKTLTSGCR